VINYADEGGSGLNLSSLIVKLDHGAIPGETITVTGVYPSSATASLTGLTQSTHTLFAQIADNADNVAKTTSSFTVGLASPTIAVAQPATGGFLSYTSTTAVINYADAGGPGLNLSSLIVKLNGTAVSGGIMVYASSATARLTGLTQRAYTLDASIQDISGDLINAVQIVFAVDLTSPTIAIALPVNGSFVDSTSTTAVINYADTGGSGLNLASLVVKLDGSSVAAVISGNQATADLVGLAPGGHILNASISDAAGNTTASQSTFTVNLICLITGINPLSGSASGGNLVTITGMGFSGLSGPGGVEFNGVDASNYSVNATSTVIIAVAPGHSLIGLLAAGTVPLTVTTGAGSCSTPYGIVLAPVAAVACGEDFFYPSPATGAVGTFAYCMDFPGTARVRVYNAIGDIVAKLEDVKQSGAQLSTLNTARLGPGVYLYVLEKDYGSGDSVHSPMQKFVVKH
jgi:hypothetical protein